MEIACSKGLSGVTKFFAKYCAFLRLYTVTVFSVQGGEIESLEDGSFVSELSISAQAACERSALRQEQALMRCRLQEAARQAKSDACECSFPSTFTFQTFTLHIFTFTSSLSHLHFHIFTFQISEPLSYPTRLCRPPPLRFVHQSAALHLDSSHLRALVNISF